MLQLPVTYRTAEEKDIDLIIEAIIESDKSGTEIISACNIFNLKINEYTEVLKNILTENFENSEYTRSAFLVAETEGKFVGTLCSWLEEKNGIPNSIIKANLLLSFIDKEKLVKSQKESMLVNSLSFARQRNAIQLEYGYVRGPYRRKGIFTELLRKSIMYHRKEAKQPVKVQSILFKDNFKSYNALTKFGFTELFSKTSNDENIFRFYPFNEKILMELSPEQVETLE